MKDNGYANHENQTGENLCQNENATTDAPKPQLSAVLNGGSDVLESALIPVQFGVNNALAEIQPTHVLVIIQDKDETETSCKGIRKVIPLSRGSDFIHFESAGKNKVTFIALKLSNSKENQSFLTNLQKEHSPGKYWKYVILDVNDREGNLKPRFEDNYDREMVVSTLQKEIIIPEEAFAKKPSNWVWNWVNLWHRHDPQDQCSYRKRCIYAFTLKPFIYLLATVAQYLSVTLASIYLIGAKVLVTLAGWRCEPIFKDMEILWGWEFNPGMVDWDIKMGYDYGVWNIEKGKFTYYPITGFAILFGALFIGALSLLGIAIISILTEHVSKDTIGGTLVVTLLTIVFGFFALLAIGCIHSVDKKMKEITDRIKNKSREKRKTEEQKRAELEKQKQLADSKPKLIYFEWLKDNLSTDKLPAKVDIAKVPVAFKRPMIHKFRLSFNATKAKVCKPFPRH